MADLSAMQMAAVHKSTFSQAYRRYIGPLGEELAAKVGMNPTTHVANVCLNPNAPDIAERAVVKHFFLSDKGWVNEYVCWLLAHALGVKAAPRAALLIGARSDLIQEHGLELNTAMKYATVPMVLWCASAIEPTLPLQQVFRTGWEQAILKTENGKRLAALDGWTGNCDRIESNALFWSSYGQVVAIDHEKMAFNQDWSLLSVKHRDEADPVLNGGLPQIKTRLLEALNKARNSTEKTVRRAANTANNEMYEHSRQKHPVVFADHSAEIEDVANKNFSPQAATNLLSFLNSRLDEAVQRRRFGLTI